MRGAADYRASIYSGPTAPGVVLSGTQPRGAVVACAGCRQRFFRSVSALGSPGAPRTTSRELMQVFDVGPNSVWDDFAIDGWYFWTHSSQGALLPGGGTEDCNANPKGAQMWKRHGRLYTTFGDSGQGILGSIYFTSTKRLPQRLGATKYTHSFFRVDSSATFRRYWHWFMCGRATRDELVDPGTRIPRVKASAAVAFYDAGGWI